MIKLFTLLLIAVFLLNSSFAADITNYSERVENILGKTVSSINIVGVDVYSKSLKNELEAFKGRPIDLQSLQQLLVWIHEGVGEGLISVYAEEKLGLVDITISLKTRKKIHSINVTGNQNFENELIKSIFLFKEGDLIDPYKIESAIKKLRNFYLDNGFYLVDISFESSQGGNFSLRIKEGPRVRVSEVEFSDIQSIVKGDQQKRLQRELRDAFGLSEGDYLVRSKIDSGIFAIKDWLRNTGFLTATNPKIKVTLNKEKTAAKLHVSIKFGPRLKFGFRGNQLFSYRELMEVVQDVKDLELGVGYIDQIKTRIISNYNDKGFYNVSIQTEIIEEPSTGVRRISLIVDEGNKIRIRAMKFMGVSEFSKQKLEEFFNENSSILVQRRIFNEKDIKETGELLAEKIRAAGFLSAKLDLVRFDFNHDKSLVDVNLFYNEGVKTTIQEIEVLGNNVFSLQEVKDTLGIEEGEPFNIFSFEKGLRILKQKYEDVGYLKFDFNNGGKSIVSYTSDLTQVNLKIEINEGPQIILGDVIVRGNKKTKSKVLTREIPFEKNDVITRLNLQELEERLRELGLFSTIIIRTIERPSTDKVRDLLILVEENSPGALEFGPGFRTDLGLRLFARVSYQNLGGWHRGVFLQGVVNRRVPQENFKRLEYNLSLGFREPWFAGWPVTSNTTLSFFHRQFSTFDATVVRLSTEFSRDLTKNIEGLLEYSLESIDLKDIGESDVLDPSDEGTRIVGAIIPSLVFDFRDDKFNPSKGFRSKNSLELADKLMASQTDVGYYRFTSTNSFYFPMMKESVFQVGVNYGFQRSNIRGKSIPPTKLFSLGGAGSIRGYGYNSINPENKLKITGSISYVVYRAEFHSPITENLRWAIFSDAGNLFVDRLEPFNVRSTLGAGIRYVTPVGPVVLDFAYKLDSTGREDPGVSLKDSSKRERWRIDFAIGTF